MTRWLHSCSDVLFKGKVSIAKNCLCVVDHNRYLAVVCTEGRQDTEESVILGIDIIADTATIGLVLSIWGDSKISLDGDG